MNLRIVSSVLKKLSFLLALIAAPAGAQTQSLSSVSGHIAKVFGVDEIHYAQNLSRVAFVRRNMRGFPKSSFDQTSHGYVLTGLIGRSAFFVYFRNFSEPDARALAHQLQLPIAMPSQSQDMPNQMLVSQKNLKRIRKTSGPTHYAAICLSCFNGIAQGIWDSTGGVVTGLWNTADSFVSNPSAWVDSIEKKWSSLLVFFSDFENQLKKTLTQLSALPAEAMAELGCGFIASMSTDILITVFSGGAGSTKLISSIQYYLAKFSKIQKFLVGLSKLGKFSNQLPATFFSAVSKGLIPERRLISIEKFAEKDLIDLATKAAACGI